MNYKKRATKFKNQFRHLFIPHLMIVHDGNEIPVVSTYQAHYEWMIEYGRAELFQKLSIIELVIIFIMIVRCIHDRI